jgi:hypothetical protein
MSLDGREETVARRLAKETASPLDRCLSASPERPFLFLHRGYWAEPGEFPIFSLASTAAQDRDGCAHATSLVQAADAHPMGDSNNGPLGYGYGYGYGGGGGGGVRGPIIARAGGLNT